MSPITSQALTGIGYQCEKCDTQFDLCYKCYELRNVLHDPSHPFKELGPEYIERPREEEPASPLQGSAAGDTDIESDSESAFSSSSSSSSDDAAENPEGENE
ncbi:uncharacterized protein PG998_010443 [Apiospora kogelbergensis]|uniref:uncharacterized protein n=1 Tax=Apiospora kogelbergensis TaxID=1337665 RepID=UPI00313066D8